MKSHKSVSGLLALVALIVFGGVGRCVAQDPPWRYYWSSLTDTPPTNDLALLTNYWLQDHTGTEHPDPAVNGYPAIGSGGSNTSLNSQVILTFDTSVVTSLNRSGNLFSSGFEFTPTASNYTMTAGSLFTYANLNVAVDGQGGGHHVNVLGGSSSQTIRELRPRQNGLITNNSTGLLRFTAVALGAGNGGIMAVRQAGGPGGDNTVYLTFGGSGGTEVDTLTRRNSQNDLAIIKEGTGTLTILNAYQTTSVGDGATGVSQGGTVGFVTGPTTINGGTISVGLLANGGSASAIGGSSNAATNLILNGGTLRYTGAAQSTDRLFSVGANGGTIQANGSGALNLTNAGAVEFNGEDGARTLTLSGTNTGANTLTPVVGNNNGATSLMKTGAGRWVLGGANTYTGATTVAQGALQLGGSNRIANASNLVLDGGTFATGGFSDTLGTLSVLANSIIDLGAGSSILNFAASNSLSWSGALTINNWSGSVSGGGTDRIFVGSNTSGLTAAQLGAITFSGFGLGAELLANGELVPGDAPPLVPGDFDGDGDVDGADFVVWQTHFPTASGATLADGDADGDSDVDGADFVVWQTNFPFTPSPGVTPVPEPAAWMLALLALGSLGMARRISSSRGWYPQCGGESVKR